MAIAKDDQFVLSGTEVFHLRCVKARGTSASVGNRTRQQLADVRGEIARMEERQRRIENDADRLAAAIAPLNAELDASRAREAEYRRQRDEAHRERDRLNAERIEAIAARDSARRELALIQHLAQQATVAPAAPADPVQQDDGKDATEKRFSLLELD